MDAVNLMNLINNSNRIDCISWSFIPTTSIHEPPTMEQRNQPKAFLAIQIHNLEQVVTGESDSFSCNQLELRSIKKSRKGVLENNFFCQMYFESKYNYFWEIYLSII